MNNQDFQKLLSISDASSRKDAPSSRSASASLGARRKSSMPMTPRAVGAGRANNARQKCKNTSDDHEGKKFKSLAVPRGVKIKTGSTGRETRQDDEREVRIRALEEQVKLGQIKQEQFERTRDEITGGDVNATHLVKGLDRKLLERVRRGEDVFAGGQEQKSEQGTSQVDADEELSRLELEEVVPIQREQTQKKGELDPSLRLAPIIGVKRSRNDILAELKAQRQAAAEAKKTTESHSGPGFRKFGKQSAPSSKIEIDDKGQEVLITVDEHGNVKRKVRKVAARVKPKTALPMPDGKAKPLGADVVIPEYKKLEPVDDEDDDIFEGVGDSYDPLGPADDDDNEDSESDEERPTTVKPESAAPAAMSSTAEMEPSGVTIQPTTDAGEQARKNNYFKDVPLAPERKDDADVPFKDPAILAALKRAAALDRGNEDGDDDDGDENQSQQKRRQNVKPQSAAERLLGAPRDRDYDDLDMGFGGSRGGDDDDDDEVDSKIKLSEWRGVKGGDDDDGVDPRAKGPRKRGSKKKKKGDKNNAADVLRVLQGRKAAAA